MQEVHYTYPGKIMQAMPQIRISKEMEQPGNNNPLQEKIKLQLKK